MNTKWNINNQIGKKVLVKVKSDIIYLDEERIHYIICDDHYCYIYLFPSGVSKEIRVRRSLTSFEKELEDDGFVRTHYNTLLNFRYFTDVHMGTTLKVLHTIGNKDGEIEYHVVSRRRAYLLRDDAKK